MQLIRLLAPPLLAAFAMAAQAQSSAPPSVTPKLEWVFSEHVLLGADIKVGDTYQGGRNIIPITGGTFAGPGIRGTIIPGGWDWQRRRADGCLEIKADYMLRTDDGVVINVVNEGLVCTRESAPPYFRTIPVFEAPIGKYDWLNKAVFVGTLTPGTDSKTPSVSISFFKVDG